MNTQPYWQSTLSCQHEVSFNEPTGPMCLRTSTAFFKKTISMPLFLVPNGGFIMTVSKRPLNRSKSAFS